MKHVPRRSLAATAIAGAVLLVPASAVFAHAEVSDLTPKPGSTGSKLVKGKTGLREKLTLHPGRFTVTAKWVADDGDTQTTTWRLKSK